MKRLIVLLALLGTFACSQPATSPTASGLTAAGSTLTLASHSKSAEVYPGVNCNPPVGSPGPAVEFDPTHLGRAVVHNTSSCTNDFTLIVWEVVNGVQTNRAQFTLPLAPGQSGTASVGLDVACGSFYQRDVFFGVHSGSPGALPGSQAYQAPFTFSELTNTPFYAPGGPLWDGCVGSSGPQPAPPVAGGPGSGSGGTGGGTPPPIIEVMCPAPHSYDNFAVLAGSTVTNSGPTTINGDLGLEPGSAITGRAQITLNGNQYVDDAVALNAQNDATSLFNADAAAGPGCTQVISADLSTYSPLVPGVYCSGGTMILSGNLTLTGGGAYVFRSVGLTLGVGSSVVMTGGVPCDVNWKVDTTATIGGSALMLGTIVAGDSINFGTGAHLDGRALAEIGQVSLLGNTIISAKCGCQ